MDMNNNNDQQIQDPSTQGVGGLKGLKGIDKENREPTIFDLTKDYNKTIRQINKTTPITKEIGFVGVGDSMYDKEISTASQLEDLEDTRAKLQSNFAKVTNGLAKGAVLAGTTFLDGTVGLVFGGLQAMEEGRGSALWDNDFSRAMKTTSEWSEKAMPNYYTKEEREEPWYNHIFTANFLGDKFIKNLGFSVGAIYSGGVWTKALQATRLPQLIGLVARSSNAPGVVSAVTGSVMAAVNEGRVEALNNATEWENTQIAKLNDWHQAQLTAIAAEHGNTDYYEDLVAEENKRYEETLAKISEDKLKMGNADLLMNIPLLMATNMFEFGKFFARGAQTARRTSNIVRNAEGLYIAEKPNWVLKGTGNVVSEGFVEEGGQGLENRVAGKYYATDVDNFYASKLDPQAEQQTLSWMKAFADGINESVNDSSAWEEVFIGGLTGALGIPRFRSMHKADGGFQSPITIEGGFLGERREANEAQKRDQEIVDYLNNRIQSPEFLNYYQGLIRHNKYQNDMNAAAEAGDTFEFKNAEHSQLLSDIAMFSNAGRLDDLTAMIESAYDLSDENLDSIIKNTTSTITSESGEELRVGPFVDSKGNPMSREEMRKKLTETRDEILNTAQEYSKTRESLDIKTNGILSEDELENLTWLKMHSANWQRRGAELFEEIKPILGRISGRLSQLADIDHYIKSEEGKSHAGLSELYEIADTQERNLNNARNLITFIQNLDSQSFGRLKPEIIKSIEDLANDENIGLPADEVQEFNEKIDDLVKAQKAADKFNVKLVEYITNPNKVKEDAQTTTERVAQEDLNNKSTNLRDKLTAVTSLSDFRQVLDTEENSDIKQKVLKELEESGNPIAQNYKETTTYDREVRRNLDQLNVAPEIKEAALRLYENQYRASSTLEELANPNSVHISDENAIYNDTLTEEENNKLFNEAQYALTEAMRKVNNDNAFKDRFSKEYKEPKSKTKPASKTQATREVNTASATITSQQRTASPYEVPVGDVTAEQISTENAEANNRVETTQSLDNKQRGRRPYYRPSIPELHIEASKEGDFRPFNVVANEKNPRVNFDDLYNYLKDHGAFDYVNAASLKVGDELGFMIDPEFNDHTIFIVDKKNNQIVGSLDESQYSVDRYEGLADLEGRIRVEYAQRSTQPQQRQFKTDYQYDNEMSFYEGQIQGTLDRVENGTAIYVDSKGQPVILLAGKSDHQFIGIFREPNSNRWSIKMENKEGGKTIFRDMMSSVMAQLPLGAEIYERTSISVDGLRVFAQQLNHGFEMGNETYETDINGGDIANIFGLSKEDQEAMEKVHISEKELPKVKEILRPYLEKFGVKNIDKVVYLTNNNTLSVKLPVLVKTKQAVDIQSKGKFIATPTTRVSQIMIGRIPYGNTERSLANIPNVSGEGKAPIFGIVKNGTLSTNGKVDDSLVTKPINMAQKEGRMYLLIPNAAGKYSPAAVRVQHFNRQEFNPNNVEVQSTQMYRNIQEAIDALANSANEEDVNNAVKTLAQNLYTKNLHIDWFSSESGNGIRFTKVQRDAQGNEIYEERNGQRLRKEEVRTVFISKGVAADPNYIGSLGVEEGDSLIDTRDINDIKKDITNILLGMNLPIQVNLGMLNKGGYNNMLVNSGVLTSNISDARVLSSWFTTDYFDSEGNLHKATNPATVTPGTQRTPVGGTEGAIPGTKVASTFSGKAYYVDLSTNTIRNDQGQAVPVTDRNRILLDLAWAQENFGDATTGSMMWDNKVITPNGEVLDRTTQKYLGYEESLRVKDIITGRATPADTGGTKKVIDQIAENQKRVDKTRTDGEFYYILEDDGQYHEYDRVHKRLGSNWVESKKQADALKDISVKLSQLSDNVTQYNNYLTNLGNHFGVDLSSFSNKTDVKNRDTIVNLIRDKMSGTNSQRALEAGTAVDSVIRNFFTSNETPVRPSNMSEAAFSNLINTLTEVKSNIEARGEKFLTNNIVLFQKYADGTRIAGEVDILSVDSNGNFRIYDVKTSRYSFYNFTDKFGHQVNYFKNESATQRMSTEAYYTQQLSAYKNLFESQYHTPITSLGIMPFVLNYEGDNISNITREKGIAITYDPAVNVPLVGAVKTTKKTPTSSSLPLFNSSLETQNPINKVLPENAFEQEGTVGYYERDGKLNSGYLKHIGTIDNVDIYLTKERDKGFGRPGELNKSSNYYVVLPNGKFVDTKTLSESDNVAADVIMKALQAKPEKVKALASEETTLSKSVITTPIVETPREATPATILSTPTVSGAARAAQAEQAINQLDSEFEDELDLGKLRKVDEREYTKWDKEKEAAWLNKVLPQMSTEDRFRVINGVIKIAESGAEAWGQFNNGIITLSDEAAEGTVYHEAFHAVFNLLLDPEERLPLFEEARKLYGEKDELSLEEDMAEAFREYVMTREKANLGQRILNFFKDLYIKVTNWEKLQPSLTSLYQQINEGKYASQGLYTPEMHNILAEAKRDSEGHLLAPNGKPTNLNERQYAQVRTRAFKNWFGNWINPYSSNISISLDIDRESIDADGFGSMVNIRLGEEEIGTIPVQQQIKSIKDFKFTKYVDINGIAGASEIYEEYRGKGYGKASYWELGMWLSRNGSILRSARDDSRTEAATRVWRSLERDGFARKVDNRYEFVDNSSKVVDENGEPLVVYHESPNKFNTFDTSRKRFNVHDVKGIWTTPVNREGWGYGDNIYPLFVNLRNPNYTHTQGTQTFGEMRRMENKALNDPNSDGAILETFDKFGPETQIYVKNANQVKSATDNMGDFSIVNNDIRYRKIQDSLFESLSNEVVEDLLKKGWTQEKFNSVSQREREQALKCLPL